MDEIYTLALLTILMGVGSFLAGSIPLAMHMSEEKLQIVSVFGAGLLVGTALVVIIPEGVRSLYSGVDDHTGHPTKITVDKVNEHLSHNEDFHSVIGLSLVLGFVFMLLVEQLSTRKASIESGTRNSEKNITATVGLVVHAAADGVALGAAASTAQADVEFIVFLAIMLHKAPAAFGLVSFLLHENLDKKRIRRHLFVFSIAAPSLAWITYLGIGQKGKETLTSINGTGIALLFSAGTFLYVAAVHVLPELMTRSKHSHGGVLEGGMDRRGLTCGELFTLVTGALMPVLLTLVHH